MDTPNQTNLDVQGMTCPSCARHVTAALQAIPGVSNIEVRMREKRVTVQHDTQVQLQQLVEALSDAGYTARVA